MGIELILSNGNVLEFQPGTLPGYAGPYLTGSIAFSAKTHFAEATVQELAGDEYTVKYFVAKFLTRITGVAAIKARGLYGLFMVKSGLRKEIEGIGKLHLRQDQYTCFFSQPVTCKLSLERNTEYRVINIFYSPQLLEELIPFFPELKTAIHTGSATSLSGKSRWLLPSMKEVLNQLLNCPFDQSTSRFYFDLKIRELLYLTLEHAYKIKNTAISFTPWEISKIHDARTILQNHVAKKPPTIRTLAKQVALNEYKLKIGFKQYFGAGIFEWLLEEKMRYARELIFTTNKPIKEICAMVGYPLTTNFITAFRRRFGSTPGSLRRK